MEYEQPIEDFMQYTDKQGINYVASKPQDLNLEPWFNDMIERYGLQTLTTMFPYVTLVLDKSTGMLKPWQPCNYNARITNAFHVLYAQERDSKPVEEKQDEYELNLTRHFPQKDPPIERNIGFEAEKMIAGEGDGYSIDYEHMPETVALPPQPKNWHPNKDANGNYRSPKPQIPLYTGYYNNYSSYLPQYQTFTQYP